jgi:galactokinase
MSETRNELEQLFAERFGGEARLLVTSPGRTEIAGNHTDHEGGNVIAGAVDRAVNGLFRPNGTSTITANEMTNNHTYPFIFFLLYLAFSYVNPSTRCFRSMIFV